MTPLVPCPRCTQALPVTAGFCRRCGLAVRTAAVPPPASRRRQVAGAPLVGVGTVAAVVLFLVAGSFVHVRSTPAVVTDGVITPDPPPGDAPTVPTAPRLLYPLPVPSHYRPSLTNPPGYDADRSHRDERYHARR